MESNIRKELDKEFSNIRQAVAVNEENIKNKKEAETLAEIKVWLENKHSDKSEHRTVRIGFGLTLEKIKELSDGK